MPSLGAHILVTRSRPRLSLLQLIIMMFLHMILHVWQSQQVSLHTKDSPKLMVAEGDVGINVWTSLAGMYMARSQPRLPQHMLITIVTTYASLHLWPSNHES